MQEYTRPGEVVVDPDHNVTTSLFNHAVTHPDRPCLSHRVGDRFVDVSTRDVVAEMTAIGKGLISVGVEPGDRVAVLSPTRMEWTLVDYAIWAAGGVTVPIYETSSPDQIQWVLEDSAAKVIVSATRELDERVSGIAEHTNLQQRFVIDEGGLDDLKARGADVSDDTVDERRLGRHGEHVATLVYTSGTTGRPKGCVITHANFVWEVTQVLAVADFIKPGTSTLLFLPLAHILARVLQASIISAGVKLGYSSGIQNLVEELGIFRPDFLIAVPRVFEKVFNGAQQRAHGDGKGRIFDKAADVAIEYSRQLDDGGPGLMTRIQHAVFDRLVYSKLRAAVGGNVTHAVSGGAALGERLGHFFRGAGITILEGYGLTETTAAATINDMRELKVGTVGKPLPGVSVRIAEDHEILISGPHVFSGYYHNDDATAEAVGEDGWFHTGDLGELDEGFLRITGRKKEILVTAGGKNVAPAVLEDGVRHHHLVSQVMVVGDGEPFIAALVTLDPEALPAWCEANDKPNDIDVLREDPDLAAEIQGAIDGANRAVSKAESIRTFRILPEDFEVGRELSQKQSVKRHVVSEKYADVIADIYQGTKASGM